MYFEDLTPYTYACPYNMFLVDEELLSVFGADSRELRLLNVGWLAGEYPFPTGNINLAEIDKIAALCLTPRSLTRGYDRCHFCLKEEAKKDPADRKVYTTLWLEQSYKEHTLVMGNGEIWIKGNSNTVYTAPTLILHYIMEHAYRIPDEVREALSEMEVSLPWLEPV